MRSGRAPLLLALIGTSTMSASVSRASGFAAARFGGELGGVTSTNPTALYYNPGGIGFSSGTSLFGDGTVALRHFSWEHPRSQYDGADPPGGEGANAGKAEVFNVFGGPAFFGKNDKFVNSTFPLAADGVQRWHLTEGAVTSIYFTLGAAYRLGPVSIGIAGNLVDSSFKNTQA